MELEQNSRAHKVHNETIRMQVKKWIAFFKERPSLWTDTGWVGEEVVQHLISLGDLSQTCHERECQRGVTIPGQLRSLFMFASFVFTLFRLTFPTWTCCTRLIGHPVDPTWKVIFRFHWVIFLCVSETGRHLWLVSRRSIKFLRGLKLVQTVSH